MLLSLAIIMTLGLFMGEICKKIKLPSLIGMLLTGIIIGPYMFNLIDSSTLLISADIRKIALIIILTRAGLKLDISGLKKMGRSALMMCFVPASLELLGVVIFGPKLLEISVLEAALLGAVLAAVSPAVVVPRMVKLIDEGYGTNKNIPQIILAGASVDDVYVIVLFTTFLGMMQGESVSLIRFVNIPVSIILGIVLGIIIGKVLTYLFKKLHMRNTIKVVTLLSASFLLVALEDKLNTPITFSALIAIMFIGVALQNAGSEMIENLSIKYDKLWLVAEIFLFVLVGTTVNISYLGSVGFSALFLILSALIFRMLGVFICLLSTNLDKKERLFTMLAYTPKATVQAAIGGIPLSLGLASGDIILTVAVLAIVLTAPLGAFAIDITYKKLLSGQT